MMTERIAPIADCIRETDDFLVVSHHHPDGDAIGSGLALMLALRAMGKKATFYTPGSVPENLMFLPGSAEILTQLPAVQTPVTIAVDCSDCERVADDYKPWGFVINIDHHQSNAQFGNLNWVDTSAAAAAEQIYQLVRYLGVAFTSEIAQCLYAGVFTDTGGFRFGNTDGEVLAAAAECVNCGAKPAYVAECIYASVKKPTVQLTGKVLNDLRFEFDERMVWSELLWSDYAAAGGEEMEPEGLVSDMRAIRGVEVSLLIHETEEGWARVGFRSRGNVDVAAIAEKVGGGGHRAASGAMVRQTPYAVARNLILDTVRTSLKELGF